MARILTLAIIMLPGGCTVFPAQQLKPLQTFRDPTRDGATGPAMVVVPAGRFMMGSHPDEPVQLPAEKPRHEVSFKEPFAISQYEITFEEYDRFVTATGHRKPSDQGWGTKDWGRTNMPVFDVSWHDAQRYAEWLSEQTGEYYQLPSEAQWEYVARAGTLTAFHTGTCINTDQANFHGHYQYDNCPTTNLYRGKTTPVGTFPSNAWGLYDVHGNIFEWTRDCWHRNYAGAPNDGNAWMNVGDNADCERRVLRGGSWSGRPRDIRSAARSRNKSEFRSIFIGFRVVRTIR